ncbi:MAG: hypothetical protein QXQ70_01345 [Candidatus Caldarchaeum sp.]
MKRNESSMVQQRAAGDSSAKSRGYCTVKIPESLARALDSYLMEEDAELYGYRSRADVVVSLLVGFLEEQGLIKPRVRKRLEHVNIYETHALVKDNLLGVTVEVVFMPPNARCCYCLRDDCIHVDYALSLPEVRKRFDDLGLRPLRVLKHEYGGVVFIDSVAYPFSTE